MGIPRFFYWLKQKRYFNVISNQLPVNVSSVAIDANGVIHKALGITYGYGEFDNPEYRAKIAKMRPKDLEQRSFEIVTQLLVDVIAGTTPRDVVVISVDGTINHAKIEQQRSRRYFHVVTETEEIMFDSNLVTPGTDYMRALDVYLRRFFKDNRVFFPQKLIYSSHLSPGEGEHKIMQFYREGLVWGPTAEQGGAHILYGLDADLMMLGLMSPLKNIVVVREDLSRIVYIDNLANELQKDFKTKTAVQDFVVLIYLIGNDFIPHNPSTYGDGMSTTINNIVDSYRKIGRAVTRPVDIADLPGGAALAVFDKNKIALEKVDGQPKGQRQLFRIDWETVGRVLGDVAEQEPYVLAAVSDLAAEGKKINPSRILGMSREDKIVEGTTVTYFNAETFRNAWYKEALGAQDERYLHLTFNLLRKYGTPVQIEDILPITPDRIEDMCIKFMEGMEWTFRYYQLAPTQVNSDWFYPYFYAPLYHDLAAVIKGRPNAVDYNTTKEKDHGYTITPIHQLIAVMPPKSFKNTFAVPPVFHQLMDTSSPIYDLFPNGLIADVDAVPIDHATGKPIERMGTIIVPKVNMARIHNALASLPIPIEIFRLYQPVETEIIEMGRSESELYDLRMGRLEGARRTTERGRGRGYGERGRGRGGRGRGFVPRGRGTPTDFPGPPSPIRTEGVIRGRVPTQITPTRGRGRVPAQITPTAPRGRVPTQITPTAPRGRGPAPPPVPAETGRTWSEMGNLI